MERTASRFDCQRSAVRANSSPSGKVSALLLLVFHLLLWQPAPAFPQEIQVPEESGVLTGATAQPGDQDLSGSDGGIADDQVTSRPTGLPTSSAGELEDAADIAEHPDAAGEKGLSSLGAAATGESGTLQPATGKSAIKQVIPEPDPTTGALIYSYPLTVPPGRNGLAPDLKLTYNSQDSQKGGYLGNRWSINIPSIERLNKTGTDRLYADDFFSSSLSGELALVSGLNYAPKVENGDFLKYSYDGASWTATDKRGTVYKFGAQGAARQDDPSDVGRVYRWMLEEVRDTNGNFIAYAYYKDGGQIYPDTITYTGNGTTSGIFKVSFERGNYDSKRPSLYYPSFPVKTAYLVTGITMSINNAWVRKYDLGYVTGDQGYRALLGSITESGRDEGTSTVTTLPATTFAYKTRGPLGWDQASTWQMPLAFVLHTGESNMLQIQDVNGDTYPDVVYSERNQGDAVYLSNTADGWSGNDANWPFPIWIKNTTGYKDHGTRIVDINGDLLADVVQSISGSSGGPPIAGSAYLNSGNPATGWVQSSSVSIPAGFVFGTNLYADDAVRIADVNGDGLADLLRSYLDDDSRLLEQQVYLSNGSGWVAAPPGTWQVPFPFMDENPSGPEIYTFAQIVDVNGDDLPDIMWRYSDVHFWWIPYSVEANLVFMNNGHGWEPSDFEKWRAPMAFEWGNSLKNGRTDIGVRATDINGDGLQDVLWSAFTSPSAFAGYAYLNSGRETPFPYTLIEPLNVTDGLATHTKLTNPKVQLADVNADGLDDFVHSDRSTFGVFVAHTELAKPNSFTDLLTSITAPSGGSYTIDYKLSNKYRSGDNSLLNPKLPLVIPTVERITVTDPVAGVSGSSTWSYKDGFYYYAAPTDRRMAGFGEITKTDPTGNVTKTFYYQGNASNAGLGEWNDHPAKIGKAYRTEQYDGAGNLYAATVSKWDKSNLGTDRDFVKLASTISLTYDGNGTHRDTATEYAYDNATGNLTQKTEWGEVAASPDGTFADVGSDKATETFSYAANLPGYVVGLPSRDTVVDQAGNKVRETVTYYDSLPFGSAGSGNPTKTEQWITGTAYVSSQRAYNTTFGTVASTTDPRGKVTSYAYDSFNFYPATVTDPLGHAVSYAYDYSSGKATQVTDQNGFTFRTLYDGLDRVIEERQPDLANPTSPVTKTAYAYTDTAGAVSVKQSDFLNAATAADTYRYFDGLGRLIQERKEAEAPGAFNVKDTVWNALGMVGKESLPSAGNGSARTSPTATASFYASYAYDALQRPVAVADATGATTYAYDDWKTTSTDKNGKVKRSYRDAFGNLARVDEISGGSTYATTYQWNLNGKLVKLTDALGNVRSFAYDGLGRRLSAEDLHASGDATFGTWTYAYDEAGNLIQTVSPNSNATSYAYNDVNQHVSEDHTGGAGTEITYTYGGCANGVGKLCTVAMLSGANSSYAYDALGNVASETRTISGISYVTAYTYDRQGNMLAITYPDSAETKYSFNGAGLLERIERKENGGAFTSVVSNFDYGPTDQPTVQAYPNGVTTTNSYDPAKLYRLTRRLTQNGSGVKLQDLNYTYDNAGNITRIVDASNTDAAKTAVYAYDDLYRLTSATVTNAASGTNYTDIYAYDALGNVTSGPAGTYLYQGNTGSLNANPHAATSVNGAACVYDNDGNLLSNATLHNLWNYRDELVETTTALATVTYLYDQNGDRVRYAKGASATLYPNKHYSTDGSKKTKQIYAGDQLVAMVETAGTVVTPYYVHADHLGSTTAVSDGVGVLAQILDYYPFGAQRISSGTHIEERQYIGQVYDFDTRLSYLNARYYHPGLGRFLSGDPVFHVLGEETQIKLLTGMNLQAVLSDPQLLNSYSYAKNNPILNSDPRGTCPACYAIAAIFLGNAPTISGYIQSLATPLGQVNASDSFENSRQGNYGRAMLGLLFAGESTGSSASKLPKVASGLKLGQDFGHLGKVVENTAGEIKGFVSTYTKNPFHGLDRFLSRGITIDTLIDTTTRPLATFEQYSGNILRLTERAGVVLDKAGQVVTVFSEKDFNQKIKSILRTVKNASE